MAAATRRAFAGAAAIAAATPFASLTPLALLGMPGAARAGEQAERAITTVRRLIAAGELRPGAVLRLRVKQGNMTSLLGRDHELKKDWERLTGIVLDATVMPQLDSLEFIRRSQDIDLTIARNHEYPDLYASGLIEDLTPLLERLGLTLAEDSELGYLLPRHQAYFGERVVAIPADLDIAMLWLRRDLLEDPRHRAQFQARHGRELRLPETWAEYQQQVEYFHRPADGFFGCAESREKRTGWMTWMPRYLSAALPNQWLFDEQMRPLVASPAGIAATESYAATVPFSPPQVLAEGNDYSYTLPFVTRGQAYSTILTLAAAKIANRDDSAVRGRVIAAPMPGRLVGGQLVRRTHLIYGNNFVIPTAARHKTLALLFAMWLTDPDNASRSVAANGLADPYRGNILGDERVAALYTPQAIAQLRAAMPTAAPSGTGLPGDSEYLAALNQQLFAVAAGQAGAREAMHRVARDWEGVTERYGRARQIGHWRHFRTLFPRAAGGAA